ncbi:MAG: hypothetical protein M1815_004094 [Lichina confinis]|nr:MAG: hypothetical protein M1815_004094 [Lichina confinis]
MVQATDLLPSSQPRVLVTILLLYSRAKTNVIASNGQKMQATVKPTPAADTKDVLRSWTAPARSGMLQQQGPTLGQADMSSINADQNNLAGSTSSVVGEGFPRSISGGSGRPQVGSVRQVASEVVPDVASKRVTQGTVRARNASTVSECISVMPYTRATLLFLGLACLGIPDTRPAVDDRQSVPRPGVETPFCTIMPTRTLPRLHRLTGLGPLDRDFCCGSQMMGAAQARIASYEGSA